MNADRGVSRRDKLCMVVAAILPWYGVLTGTFLFFIFVLMAAARLGSLVFGALWLGVIPLAILLLLVNPTAFILLLCGGGRLSGMMKIVAQIGSAVTLVFSILYSGISSLLALTAFGVVQWTEYDPVFGFLTALNATILAFGSWCVIVAQRALRRLGKPQTLPVQLI